MAVGGLRIGAVAERIGVPAATLRTWERRYQVTSPQRQAGRDRRYSDEDVARLGHIVALRGHGERVSDLAKLSLDELAARHGRYAPMATPVDRDGKVRVVLLGPIGGGVGGATSDGRGTVEVVARHAERIDELPDVDAVVVAMELLGDEPAAFLRSAHESWSQVALLVTYAFAPKSELAEVSAQGARTIRRPWAPVDLQAAIVDAVRARRGVAPWPAPTLRPEQLRVLQRADVELACECPNQLASLALALAEFEAYSRRCASRTPEDAALHRRIGLGTRRARGLMESLLREVCSGEGISWPTE